MTCNQCQFTKAGNLPLKIALEKVLQPKEHHLVEFSASGFEVPVLVIRKGTSSMTVSSSQWPRKQGDHWLFPTPRNSATCLTCLGVARVNLRGVWRVLAPVRSLVRIAQQPRMTRNKYKLGSSFNSPVAEFRIVSYCFTLFHVIRNHPVDHALDASLPLHLQVLRVCRGQQKRHGNFWELAASDIMLSNSGLRKGAWVDSLACRIWEVCPSEFALNSNQFISRGFNPSQPGSMLESWSQVRYIETTIKISVVCPETGTSKESKAFSPRIHNQPEIVGLLGFVRSGRQFSDSSLLYDGINQQELGLKCYQLIL